MLSGTVLQVILKFDLLDEFFSTKLHIYLFAQVIQKNSQLESTNFDYSKSAQRRIQILVKEEKSKNMQ